MLRAFCVFFHSIHVHAYVYNTMHTRREIAEDMFRLTSPDHAPWNLVEGNFKWYARVKVVKAIVKALDREIGD